MNNVKFGTGGFRGIIGDTFTKKNIKKISQAIANITKTKNLKKQICIGYDNRFMSEDYAKYCAEVFLANKFVVNLFEKPCATPVVMFQTKIENNDFGIMITASHNPYNYNGIKVFTKLGKDATIEETKEIENEYNSIKSIFTINLNNYKGHNLKFVDHTEEFVDYIINNQNVPKFKNLKVVFDNKFGSSAKELELFCKKTQIKEFKILNSNRDPFFNFEAPAPTKENVEQLKNELLQNNFDVGFAVDADGDRLGIVDEKGNYIDNNLILALVYYYFVKYEHKKGGIIKNVATSSIIDLLAQKFGSICYEVPVGFKYVSGKLRQTNAIVGGESSGGLAIQNHLFGKDSLISIVLCLKILNKLQKPFSEMIAEMLHFVGDFKKYIEDKQFPYSIEKEKTIKNLIFSGNTLPELKHKITKISRQDGLKIFYENNNWVLIRFSGTEPVLRMFVEFDSEQDCKQEFNLWQKFLGL